MTWNESQIEFAKWLAEGLDPLKVNVDEPAGLPKPNSNGFHVVNRLDYLGYIEPRTKFLVK